MADHESPAAEQLIKSEFLEKFVKIPAVKSSIDYYNQVKGYNQLTTVVFNAAEVTARYLAGTAKPFLKNIEPTAQAIDKLVCESLVVVEEKYPSLMKEPEEMVGIIEEKAILVMDKTEVLVDKYLPAFKEGSPNSKESPTDSEKLSTDSKDMFTDSKETPVDSKEAPVDSKETPTDSKEKSSTFFERACKLNRKICFHVFCNGLKKIILIQVLVEEFKSKWPKIFKSVMQFKEALLSKTIRECLNSAREMWHEILKDLLEPSEAEKNFYQRLPSLTYEMAYMEVVETGKRHTLELFTQIVQVSNCSEMLINCLHSTKEKLCSLEEIIKNMETKK